MEKIDGKNGEKSGEMERKVVRNRAEMEKNNGEKHFIHYIGEKNGEKSQSKQAIFLSIIGMEIQNGEKSSIMEKILLMKMEKFLYDTIDTFWG